MKKNNYKILPEIYERLFVHYGPQFWWPAESPFEVMVGAVLTQSAAWVNVEKAIANIKKAGVMSPSALRRLPAVELAELIYPAGYYNVKAIKLHALVNWLHAFCGDNLSGLFRLETPMLRRELLNVYGIGPETADSILLYAAAKPVFVIDAYTIRIVCRLGLSPDADTYDAYQAIFLKNLPVDVQIFKEYHALLVCLAKESCRKKPLCAECCLCELCNFQR